MLRLLVSGQGSWEWGPAPASPSLSPKTAPWPDENVDTARALPAGRSGPCGRGKLEHRPSAGPGRRPQAPGRRAPGCGAAEMQPSWGHHGCTCPAPGPVCYAEVALAHGLLQAQMPPRHVSLGRLRLNCPESQCPDATLQRSLRAQPLTLRQRHRGECWQLQLRAPGFCWHLPGLLGVWKQSRRLFPSEFCPHKAGRGPHTLLAAWSS